MRQVAFILAVSLLAACASTPEPHYYTLDMTPAQDPAAEHLVRVERFTAAEPLARRNILIKKTPTQIEYYVGHQWAASPAGIVAETTTSASVTSSETRLTTRSFARVASIHTLAARMSPSVAWLGQESVRGGRGLTLKALLSPMWPKPSAA